MDHKMLNVRAHQILLHFVALVVADAPPFIWVFGRKVAHGDAAMLVEVNIKTISKERIL
jgi:hypothetical protein